MDRRATTQSLASGLPSSPTGTPDRSCSCPQRWWRSNEHGELEPVVLPEISEHLSQRLSGWRSFQSGLDGMATRLSHGYPQSDGSCEPSCRWQVAVGRSGS